MKNHHIKKGDIAPTTITVNPDPSFEVQVLELFETLSVHKVNRCLEVLVLLTVQEDMTRTLSEFADQLEVSTATMTVIPQKMESYVRVRRQPGKIGKYLVAEDQVETVREAICLHFRADQVFAAFAALKNAEVTVLNAALTMIHTYLDDILPMAQIHEMHGFSTASGTMHVDRLEERKLIERVRDPVDRRRWSVVLTGLGTACVEEFFDNLRR